MAMSYNKVFLMGNLCADVEVRSIGGTSVGKLRLAVDESFTSKSGEKVEKTVFVDVDAWDKLADNCAKLVGKGCSVLVEGKLQMDEWTDKTSGQKRTKLKVRADRVMFLTYKDGAKGGEDADRMRGGETTGPKSPTSVRDTPFDDEPPF
jgi:single-strand DNA-binding protein